MRRLFASALFATATCMAYAVYADDAATAAAAQPASSSPQTADKAPSQPAPANGSKAELMPVSVTAKRVRQHLKLRLTAQRLDQVLNESGVQPVAETDPNVETVEVTAKRVQQEPITQGIPALYYGITHPSEAWRIFAPIQQ